MKQGVKAVFNSKEDLETAFNSVIGNWTKMANSEVEPFHNGKVFTLGKKGDTDMTVTSECHFKMTIEWKDNPYLGIDKDQVIKTLTDNKGLIEDTYIAHL